MRTAEERDPADAGHWEGRGFSPSRDKGSGRAGGDGSDRSGAAPTRPALELVALPKLGPTNIPPRRWAYGHFLLFGETACLAAVDGGGKGAQAVAIALSFITGKPLLGERVWRSGRVAIITYEDKEEEWHRRIAAACLHYGVDYETALDNIRFIVRPRGRVVFASRRADDGTVIFPDHDDITAALQYWGPVLLIVDPLNHAHDIDDGNNNVLMAKVAAAMNRVAEEADVAVLVLHHLRKGSTGQVDDMMGATAVRSTFRSSRIMMGMTKTQAADLGIKDGEWRYSAIASTKDNYAPPPDKAKWYRLEGRPLENISPEYPEGDDVAVATTWECRPMFEGMTAEQLEAVFDALRAEPFNPNRQAKNWAGYPIMKAGGRSVEEAKKILAGWVKSGTVSYEDTIKKNNNVQKVVLNEEKVTEILASLSPTFDPQT